MVPHLLGRSGVEAPAPHAGRQAPAHQLLQCAQRLQRAKARLLTYHTFWQVRPRLT